MFWHKGAIAIRVITYSQTISLCITLFKELGFLLLLYFVICGIILGFIKFASAIEFDLMITMLMRVLKISLSVEIPPDVHI